MSITKLYMETNMKITNNNAGFIISDTKVLKDLPEEFNYSIMSKFAIIHNLCKCKVRENIKDICIEEFPLEFSDSDNEFFDKYKGKEVIAYNWNGGVCNSDWFILEDDNISLSYKCFEFKGISYER